MTRKYLIRGMQVVVAIVAFAFILLRIDWHVTASMLSRASLWWFFCGSLLSLVSLGFAAQRWKILLNAAGLTYRFRQALRCYTAGAFYGLAMPGAVGGDVARGLLCRQDLGVGMGLVAVTIFVERALGLVALLLILSAGIISLAGPKPYFSNSLGVVLGVVAIGVVLILFWLSSSGLEIIWGRIAALLPDSLRALVSDLRGFRSVRLTHLLSALVLTLAFQLADLEVTRLIGQALDIRLTTQALLVALPLVYLAIALPISPAGLGVREATLAVTLAGFGYPSSSAALLALAVFINRALVGLVCGAIYALTLLRSRGEATNG